jgi:hypothetical protein
MEPFLNPDVGLYRLVSLCFDRLAVRRVRRPLGPVPGGLVMRSDAYRVWPREQEQTTRHRDVSWGLCDPDSTPRDETVTSVPGSKVMGKTTRFVWPAQFLLRDHFGNNSENTRSFTVNAAAEDFRSSLKRRERTVYTPVRLPTLSTY